MLSRYIRSKTISDSTVYDSNPNATNSFSTKFVVKIHVVIIKFYFCCCFVLFAATAMSKTAFCFVVAPLLRIEK